jgi:chemotaxis protein histidine kinase CheA
MTTMTTAHTSTITATTAPNGFLELQGRFMAGLERRTTDLTTTLDGSADPESLMRMFHSLAGIGGTYGYPRITELGRSCEALCVSAIDERRSISSAAKERLRRAVAEIRAFAPQVSEATMSAA